MEKCMNQLVNVVPLLTLLAFSTWIGAAPPEKGIREKVEAAFPGLHIDTINKTPVTGLYEVMVGAEIVYVSSEGRYLIHGDLLDLEQNKQNLTEEKKGKARLELVNGVGESTMIVFRPKETKYTLTVFTDTDCGYCRKFHEGVGALNAAGVAVRYVAFPRAGEGSPTYNTMVSVWCAKDPHAAITKTKQGYPIPVNKCPKQPVDKHLAVVRQLNLTGTPVILFEDGSMLPGYLPANQLVERIQTLKPSAFRKN